MNFPLQSPHAEHAAALAYKTLPVDTQQLVVLVQAMRSAGVKYRIAKNDKELAAGIGKANFSTPIPHIKAIDCSGFARYALFKASSGRVVMPDGSCHQNEWCRHQPLAPVNYQKTAGLMDGHLRITFFQGHPGHVWMTLNGKTIESHGHLGPDQRDWHTPTLFARASVCYQVT